MTSRVAERLAALGFAWTVGVSVLGAELSMHPWRLAVPVIFAGLVGCLSSHATRRVRWVALGALGLLWLLALVASATIGLLYLPGLACLSWSCWRTGKARRLARGA